MLVFNAQQLAVSPHGPRRIRRRPVTDNWTQRFSEIFRDFVFGDFGGLPGRPRGPDFAKMWPRSVAKFWQSLSKIGALATPFVAKIRFCRMSKFREQNISERFSVYPYRNCSYLNFVLALTQKKNPPKMVKKETQNRKTEQKKKRKRTSRKHRLL